MNTNQIFPKHQKVMLILFSLILLPNFVSISQQVESLDIKKIGAEMIRNHKDDMTGDIIKRTYSYPLFGSPSERGGQVSAGRFNSKYDLTFDLDIVPNQEPFSRVPYISKDEYIIIKFSNGTTIKLFHVPDNKLQDGYTYLTYAKSLTYKVTSSAYELLTTKPVVKIRFYICESSGDLIDKNMHLLAHDRDIPIQNQKTIQTVLKALKGPTTNNGVFDGLMIPL